MYPMHVTRIFIESLRLFSKEVGNPEVLVADPCPTKKKQYMRDFCNKIDTTQHILKADTQWYNRSELYVGLLKLGTWKDIREAHSPSLF